MPFTERRRAGAALSALAGAALLALAGCGSAPNAGGPAPAPLQSPKYADIVM